MTTFIDITHDHCPMTFVKAKIALSKLQLGDRLVVKLSEGEPLENVPRSAVEQGYKLISNVRVDTTTHEIILEK